MKFSYGLGNLRSIGNMEPVELRPITILVGANSSGKSTFLRSIPLLRQSLKIENHKSLILWTKEGEVDFGNFETAAKDKDADKEISLKINLDCSDNPFYAFDLEFIKAEDDNYVPENFLKKINYEVGFKHRDNSTLMSKIEIRVMDFDLSFKIEFTESSNRFFLNGEQIDESIFDMFNFYNDSLFHFYMMNEKFITGNIFSKPIFSSVYSYLEDYSLIFANAIFDEISKHVKAGEEMQNALSEAIKIAFTYPLSPHTLKKMSDSTNVSGWKDMYSEFIRNGNSETLKKIKVNSILNLIFYSLSNINHDLLRFFVNSKWIGPIRDLDSRFNAFAPLNSFEISPKGENLHLILEELKNNGELNKFSDWVNEVIGYEVDIDKKVQGIEIIVIRHGLKVNLVDTSVGISQILPILLQIWLNTLGSEVKISYNKDTEYEKSFYPILMEQPELHLHPMHQAQIADALVGSLVCDEDLEPQQLFIIETHSEVFINRLGQLIYEGGIPKEHAQIVFFDFPNDGSNTTDVRVSTFNDDGTLNNWPYGFFNF